MATFIHGYTIFKEDLDHIADHLGAVGGQLKGARLLITGGTGFFGIWLLEGLLYAKERDQLDIDISVISRDPARFLSGAGKHLSGRGGITWLAGSMRDFNMNIGPFSHILHAASEANPDGLKDWSQRHMTAAIAGMQRLIEMAEAQKTEAILVTTSGAVYNNAEPIGAVRFVEGPGSIDDFTSEKHVYGQTKRFMETMLAVTAQQAGYRALIARCFAFVGPYLALDSNYAIGNFMRDALAAKPIVVSGDGTPLRSYLYAADLVIWLMVIMARGASGRPYNVGGEAAYSIADLAHLVNRCGGGTSQVIIRQSPRPGVVPSAYLPNLERARAELGLQPFVGLEDAVSRTLAWHRLRQRNI